MGGRAEGDWGMLACVGVGLGDSTALWQMGQARGFRASSPVGVLKTGVGEGCDIAPGL